MFWPILVVSLLGFLTTSTVVLAQRLGRGAGWGELVRTRSFEIVPVRGLFWVALGLAWALLLLDLLLLGKHALSLFTPENRTAGTFLVVLLTAGLAWPLHRLRRLVQEQLIDLPGMSPPAVRVGRATLRRGIDPGVFTTLGIERYPNDLDPHRRVYHVVRWALVVAAVLTVGLVAWHLFGGKPSGPARPFPTLAAGFGCLLAYSAAVLLGALLWENRDYTLVGVRTALALQLGLGLAGLGGLYLMFGSLPVVEGGLALWAGACGYRAWLDLRLAWQHRRTKAVSDPIAGAIRARANYLPALLAHPTLRQPPLHEEAVRRRITQGCKNLEEKGPLVTRHFGRLMDLIEVEYEDCVSATLRYLTVRRYVTLTAGVGTALGLRHPRVPAWDLGQFPLKAPGGYVNWLDPLVLGSRWDVVATCGTCGGTGQVLVTITEYRTEYGTDHQGQSVTRQVQVTRQEWRTCGTCGGTGRLLHQQVLNTHWQRLLPAATAPEMRMPELVEDAGETTFLHLPLVENFAPAPQQVKVWGGRNEMTGRMLETARQLAALHPVHTRAVEGLHDGRLYRADFQIAAFRTIRIHFRRLGGRTGWFFGRRPEFYFPRLPLSWATLGTLVFLPPLAAALGAGMLGLGWFLLSL